MVGNDIVDLAEARHASNWQRPRFLNKLFSESEQGCIQDAANPFRMVWRLWSIKEASYKLYTQLNPARFYNPKAFECAIENSSAIVKFSDFRCFVETRETSNYIISEARLHTQKWSSKVVRFKNIDQQDQSEELKRRLLHFVSGSYQLKKNEMGVPILTNGKDRLNVSLTHHGSYGAFVIG
ncbi:4-phosphopantetheinyl transferase family protein [Flagellimonas lutimaris]|uniref:4-phosphopantetheinyl transferase family protein n=1 Tax=Flagellimonas lutimaris TaxID=475082 RepID=A0A3A1NDU1_9FLAO|nr:4'-phosphopantetheinyl transferase superfamily protein [Allomuricauda lutimaris]RIV36190.1 4-phosphopantetheinyl transferase family protein [Allomuricauda lutimaris]|tara:strand:- start:212 stop:754 length:543 start_codon:yes stop_codon:yes gene_type:complete